MSQSNAQIIGFEAARNKPTVADADNVDQLAQITLSLRQEMSRMMAQMQNQFDALSDRVEASLARQAERVDDLVAELGETRQSLGEHVDDTRYELELTNQRLTAELDDMLGSMKGTAVSGEQLSEALLALAEQARRS
ncbi:MAG: hypothetical protein AAGI15_01515 [Pseudomonadota bacterium]